MTQLINYHSFSKSSEVVEHYPLSFIPTKVEESFVHPLMNSRLTVATSTFKVTWSSSFEAKNTLFFRRAKWCFQVLDAELEDKYEVWPVKPEDQLRFDQSLEILSSKLTCRVVLCHNFAYRLVQMNKKHSNWGVEITNAPEGIHLFSIRKFNVTWLPPLSVIPTRKKCRAAIPALQLEEISRLLTWIWSWSRAR